MSSKNKVLICYLGNINYDTRCTNIYNTLSANGFKVEFIGFDWLTKNFEEIHGNISIIKLKKGFLSLSFYLKFIWNIKAKLITSNVSIIFAEDIYTLPFAVIFGKLKRAKVYYDSRELYSHLAGLKEKKLQQKFWAAIEKFFIKKVDYILTTGEKDSDFLNKTYGVENTILLRNLPRYYKPAVKKDLKTILNIGKDKKILLYQGVILKGRGIKIILNALQQLPQHVLVIAGGGEYEDYYKSLTAKMNLTDQVYFIGKFSQNDLAKITGAADIGLAIIENLSISYYYALPNKLFEYIMAELPVITSNLPQMKKIIEDYDVGLTINPDSADELVYAIIKISDDDKLRNRLIQNCKSASEKLNWESEVTNLLTTLTH